MALTHEQQASRLFKSSMGSAETSTSREFFEEPKRSELQILASQIWRESDQIPTTAPTLNNGETSGVIKYVQDLTLIAIPGTTNSFYHDDLKDCIPFNFDLSGSYNYDLKDNLNNQIAFGQGNWIVDTSAGVLTFYSTVPGNMPPKISFYKYVGSKGVGGDSLEQLSNVQITSPQDDQALVYDSSSSTWKNEKVKDDVFKFESVSPSVFHEITHNLNTYDLTCDVLVEDSLTGYWTNDIVKINYVSQNKIEVWLTESCNIRLVIIKK